MVGIFLSGPGGAGKTTIIEHIFPHNNNNNHNKKKNPFKGWSKIVEVARGIIQEQGLVSRDFTEPRRHLTLQEPILRAQNRAESDLERNGADYVSDRCVLDCLAYARWRCDQLEDEEAWRNFKDKLKDEIAESVERYQAGLVVLVHPWRPEGGTKGDEDGVRLTMDRSECGHLMKCLVTVAEEFNVAYLVKMKLKVLGTCNKTFVY